MKKSFGAAALCSALLVGCTGVGGTDAQGHIASPSDDLIAIAAPYQDLSTVRINPEDGCYEYRHLGPVETTYLPLRTREGNPLCSRPPE